MTVRWVTSTLRPYHSSSETSEECDLTVPWWAGPGSAKALSSVRLVCSKKNTACMADTAFKGREEQAGCTGKNIARPA